MIESKRERYIRLLKSKADLDFVELTFDAVKEIIELLEETEIIKCKYCIHYPNENADCPLVRWGRNENDFCSFSERKEECTP